MRFLAPAAVILASLTGCAGDSLTLEYQSTLWSETRGLVLYDDEPIGHAAMWDTTCQFDVRNGWVTFDVDLPTDSEEVHDVRGDTVLAKSTQGAHRVTSGSWNPAQDVALSGAHEVRLADDGVVALGVFGGDCAVSWADGATTTLDVDFCQAGNAFAINDRGDLAFATTGNDGLYRITEAGAEHLADGINAIAWGEAADQLYVGHIGDSEVSAIDTDGAVTWTADLGGELFDMDDMGVLGHVAATVTSGSGAELVVIDGSNGHVLNAMQTPVATEVVVARNGEHLGLVTQFEAYFFNVREGSRAPQIYTTSPDPSVFDD